MKFLKHYSFYYITAIIFLGSLWGQWMTHSGPAGMFWNAVLENWQSEMGQLLWQVGGLAIFYALGSPSSKEEADRTEAKLDWLILNHPDISNGDEVIQNINQKFEQ